MSFAFIIFIRVLFVACMVFIIGHIFGSFGKRPVLKTISRVAAMLVIVLFIAMNGFFMRAAMGSRWHDGDRYGHRPGGWRHDGQECPFESRDNHRWDGDIPSGDTATMNRLPFLGDDAPLTLAR